MRISDWSSDVCSSDLIANDRPFVLLAGPCAIESRDHALEVAEVLVAVCGRAGVPLIYKSSFDKANRTSVTAGRGIGMTAGLEILAEVRERFGCPVRSEEHTSELQSLMRISYAVFCLKKKK